MADMPPPRMKGTGQGRAHPLRTVVLEEERRERPAGGGRGAGDPRERPGDEGVGHCRADVDRPDRQHDGQQDDDAEDETDLLGSRDEHQPDTHVRSEGTGQHVPAQRSPDDVEVF
jgi:hypothetical protein